MPAERALPALLDEIFAKHFPNPPASPEEISAFEQRVGWSLDEDLRAFYLRCNGANLFRQPPEIAYRLLPLADVRRARIAVFGRDEDSRGPASWYVLCDVGDGDYAGIDVQAKVEERYAIFDIWHEAFPDPAECERIADSFAEFLERALRSGGHSYWLG
jgi:cell wall assembly regulator SMI1